MGWLVGGGGGTYGSHFPSRGLTETSRCLFRTLPVYTGRSALFKTCRPDAPEEQTTHAKWCKLGFRRIPDISKSCLYQGKNNLNVQYICVFFFHFILRERPAVNTQAVTQNLRVSLWLKTADRKKKNTLSGKMWLHVMYKKKQKLS